MNTANSTETETVSLPCIKRFPGITAGITRGEVCVSVGDAVEIWTLRGVRHAAIKSVSADAISFTAGKPLKLSDVRDTEHSVESGRVALFHKSLDNYKEPVRRCGRNH